MLDALSRRSNIRTIDRPEVLEVLSAGPARLRHSEVQRGAGELGPHHGDGDE